MDEPTQADIDKLKAAHADRSLKSMSLLEKDADGKGTGEEFTFIYTGPSKTEYEKYIGEMEAAGKLKTDLEKTLAVRDVMERLSLQQIRWPDRQTVSDIFQRYPMLVLNTGKEISNSTGDSFEVRSKKL